MKQFKTYIHIMAMLLTMMLTACSDSVVNDTPSTSDAEDGYYTASPYQVSKSPKLREALCS